VPTAQEAIGRVCLVDGTSTSCWSYADHAELCSRNTATRLNAQLVSSRDGSAVYTSDPLPRRTDDAAAMAYLPRGLSASVPDLARRIRRRPRPAIPFNYMGF
jgi:hypothetical protein